MTTKPLRMTIPFLAVFLFTVPSAFAIDVGGGFDLGFYGFVLVNAAYNTDDVAPGADVPWSATEGDGSFLITARQTRLGLKVSGPEVRGAKTQAKVETDFWGLYGNWAAGSTQSAPRLRLANVRLTWDNFALTIGQDWTRAFSPLHPSSLAHVAIPEASGSGNLWARVPQIRGEYKRPLGDATRLDIRFALVRPMAANYPVIRQPDVPSMGEDSNLPHAQLRLGVSHKLLGDKPLSVGLGAQYGKLKNTPSDTMDTWGFCGDLVFPIGPITLSGEFFTGKLLPQYFSLGRGYFFGSGNRYGTKGGWAQIKYNLTDAMALNVGYGSESHDLSEAVPAEVAIATVRENSVVFLNTMYALSRNCTVALEYNFMKTIYYQQAVPNVAAINSFRGDNHHVNMAFKYAF